MRDKNTLSVGLVIQARMGSTRFPGKTMKLLAGKPLLQHVIQRLEACRCTDDVVVATSTSPADDPIVELCAEMGVSVFRGDEENVRQRYLDAAEVFGFEIIARATADNPLTDPKGIDDLAEAVLTSKASLAHNKGPDGYPVGTGAEVFTTDLLREAGPLANDALFQHLVAFCDSKSNKYKALSLAAPPHLRRPNYYLTVDYPSDWQLIEIIYSHFEGDSNVGLSEVVAFLDAHPELVALNRHHHAPLFAPEFRLLVRLQVQP